jgi:hypothetical protein
MKVFIQHQSTYSRGELLLRTFFGIIYMLLPHLFVLIFVGIAALFINFISFWIILFTGNYPRGMWNFMLGLLRWSLRLNARFNNLVDGYPAFGISGSDSQTSIELDYPETSSRGTLLLRTFFGFLYVLIPHGFCLFFLGIGAIFVKMIAFWIVLFTGEYPKGMHDFMVGVERWGLRVNAYMYNLTDTYPPFSLHETEGSNGALDSQLS